MEGGPHGSDVQRAEDSRGRESQDRAAVVEALRLGAKSRHGREAGGVYWRKQTVPLTLANDSGRLTGNPEVMTMASNA